MLSHPAIHCLDSSGLSEDTAQLHFLHLVTVAHIVQILLTSVPGENLTFPLHRQQYNIYFINDFECFRILMFADSCVHQRRCRWSRRVEEQRGRRKRECVCSTTLSGHIWAGESTHTVYIFHYVISPHSQKKQIQNE